MRLVHIGFGNFVNANRVVALLNPDSKEVKKVIWRAEGKGKLADITGNKKTRAVLLCDTDEVILSALTTETIAERAKKEG